MVELKTWPIQSIETSFLPPPPLLAFKFKWLHWVGTVYDKQSILFSHLAVSLATESKKYNLNRELKWLDPRGFR